MSDPILEVTNLHVEIASPRGPVQAVRGASLSLRPGEFHGIVGESGCGKSTLLRAMLGLLPSNARVTAGEVRFQDRRFCGQNYPRIAQLRGNTIGMIFQEPLTALNPVMKVGDQIAEAPRWRLKYPPRKACERALELMNRVGIPDAARRYDAYPHQLSGGLRQRVLIAMALSAEPQVLLCDEPTTALDVTIQDQILRLLESLSAEGHLSVIYVTHDLAVVARICDRVSVMYAGQIVEEGTVSSVYRLPRHPYTAGLLAAVPDARHRSTLLTPIPGAPPDLVSPPSGCPFHPRCAYRQADCASGEFPLRHVSDRHWTACRYSELLQPIGANTTTRAGAPA
jgi:peptide/nickel transport system ATP-binding protein/oligopeptide transport system ATP-binding protein